MSFQEPNTGCILWIGSATRYGRLDITENGIRRHAAAHRVAWELAHGAIPAGMLVCHRCDVGLCINVDHLFLGTHQENMDDMVSKGRGPGRPVVSDELIAEGKRLRAAGASVDSITELFGISSSHTSRLLRGQGRGRGNGKRDRGTP
jgi:hypothetical protein